MKTLNSGNVVRLALDAITVGKRLRSVSPVQVQNLLLMAGDTGITTPIHVRKTKDGYELIDGAHRLAAAVELGHADIAALVVECRQDEARAMEASNNLGAARMTPLQTAVFVASWKRDYYALHPDRKPGVFKGNRHTKILVGDIMSVTRNSNGRILDDINSLDTVVADSFGITERHARRILAVGERLSAEEISLLDTPARRIALGDLLVLSKIGEPEERAEVVGALVNAVPTSANKSWAAIKTRKAGIKPVVKDAVDDAFRALSALWSRAPKAAKRRFVDTLEPELSNLLIQRRDAITINNKLGLPDDNTKGREIIARRNGMPDGDSA